MLQSAYGRKIYTQTVISYIANNCSLVVANGAGLGMRLRKTCFKEPLLVLHVDNNNIMLQ